nr:cadherin-like domain-containing protein [uncultured Shimia sp.]
MTDSEGLADSFTFHWAVTGTNDAPRLTASVPQLSTPEDTPITIRLSDLHYTDPDGDPLDHLTILEVPYASQGVLMLNGVQVAANTQVSAADLKAGHLVFQPATDVHRTDTYFRFTTNDGHTDSNPARAHINITPVNDAPTASAGDLGQTTQNTPRTFTDSELVQAVHGADVDTGDALSVHSVQVDPSYGSIARHGAGQWIFTPAVGFHHDNIPITVLIQDRAGATASATASLDVVQTYRPPDLSVHVDIGGGRTIPAAGSGSGSSTGNSFQGGYNHHLDQMMQQLQRDHGGHVVRHVHDEVKGSEHGDRVFILDNMRDEEINMEKGSDLFYLRGTTHEKIEGKEGRDTLILGSYDSSRHGPHSWRHIPEIKDVENIMTNDGVWVKGGPPPGFDARYFQANPPTPPPHHAYDIDIRLTDHVAGDQVTGIRISGLAAGLALLDHTGQPISQNHDGSYTIDPAHTDVTLVSDHDLAGHSPGFETIVTTENTAMGMQTVTTQHANGHVDHVDTPIVSHDEPVDDGLLSATVTVEFDVVEDGGTVAGLGESAHTTSSLESLTDDNGQTNPYLEAIGAHSPSDAETTANEAGQSNHYLDALGVSGSASSEDNLLDPATLDNPEDVLDPNSDAPSDQTDTDLPVDEPLVPLPEDDDPSTNSG